MSKPAAQIILTDDNFASILTGVEQGRLMFDNLKKSTAYTMTSNIAKMVSVLICLLTNMPLAWGITAVLCIDFMNIIGAISLAYEKAETDVMKRRPRDPQHDRLLNKR
jgi:sodium/potassium-transporting ATPase subunit alpha